MKSFQLHNPKSASAHRIAEFTPADIPWKDLNALIGHLYDMHSISEVAVAVMNMLRRSRWFINISVMILPYQYQTGKYDNPIFIEHSENGTDIQSIRNKTLLYFANLRPDDRLVPMVSGNLCDYVPDSINSRIWSHYAAITFAGKDLGVIYVDMDKTKKKSVLRWIDLLASMVGKRIQDFLSGFRLESYYTFFDYFPDAVIVINHEKQILYKNKAAVELIDSFQRESDEGDMSFISGNSIQQWIHILNQSKKYYYRDDIRIGNKIFRVQVVPGAELQSHQRSYFLMLQDISEERDQQSFQIHRSQMSLLGHMTSNIAHHCNNPLTAIQGLSEILMNQFYGRPEYNDLKTIHAETEKLINIIRKLIQFSRYSGNPESCDLNKLIHFTLMFFDENIDKRSITCHLKLNEIPAIHLFAVDELSLILYHIFNFCINCYEEKSKKANVHINTYLVNSVVYFDVICEYVPLRKKDMTKLFIPFTGDTYRTGLDNLNLAMAANLLHTRHSEIEINENNFNGFTLSCKFPTFKNKKTDSYLTQGDI